MCTCLDSYSLRCGYSNGQPTKLRQEKLNKTYWYSMINWLFVRYGSYTARRTHQPIAHQSSLTILQSTACNAQQIGTLTTRAPLPSGGVAASKRQQSDNTCTSSNFRDRSGTSTESNCFLASLILRNDSCPSDLLIFAVACASVGLVTSAPATPVVVQAAQNERRNTMLADQRPYTCCWAAVEFVELANR